MVIGDSSVKGWSFPSGVVCHAAFCIASVMFSTAFSMSISVYRGIVRGNCSSRISLKQLESVLFAV